jgi:hypothetical protein
MADEGKSEAQATLEQKSFDGKAEGARGTENLDKLFSCNLPYPVENGRMNRASTRIFQRAYEKAIRREIRESY